MIPDQKLAVTLHDMLCQHNHTDGCGWYYDIRQGIDDWSGSEHGAYMQKVLTLRGFCVNHGITTATAIDLLKLIK